MSILLATSSARSGAYTSGIATGSADHDNHLFRIAKALGVQSLHHYGATPFGVRFRSWIEKAHFWDIGPLLRPRRARPRHRATQQTDELPSPHCLPQAQDKSLSDSN